MPGAKHDIQSAQPVTTTNGPSKIAQVDKLAQGTGERRWDSGKGWGEGRTWKRLEQRGYREETDRSQKSIRAQS